MFVNNLSYLQNLREIKAEQHSKRPPQKRDSLGVNLTNNNLEIRLNN